MSVKNDESVYSGTCQGLTMLENSRAPPICLHRSYVYSLNVARPFYLGPVLYHRAPVELEREAA